VEVAAVLAVAGALVGLGVRWSVVWLGRQEGLAVGRRPWQVHGPPAAIAALYGLFGWRAGLGPTLAVDALWIAVLAHVAFFDLEHRVVLDRVLVPAAVAAVAVSVVIWRPAPLDALLTGAASGILLLAAAGAGRMAFGATALGLGDVKLGVLCGLMLGFPPVLLAALVAAVSAGIVAAVLLGLRRAGPRDRIAYGPFLAGGALAALLQGGVQ
jgi:prepilin signal peptidase PulO-like enzyme (type II secretory pathway)